MGRAARVAARGRAAGVFGVAALLLTSGTAASGQETTSSNPPGFHLKAKLKDGTCGESGYVGGYSPLGPRMPADPKSIAIGWSPGLLDTDCKEYVTQGGKGIAERLSAAIDAAPIERHLNPNGIVCANAVWDVYLFFEYGGRRRVAYLSVDVGSTHCSLIDGVGTTDRISTSEFRSDLATLAPNAAWKARVLGTEADPRAPSPDGAG